MRKMKLLTAILFCLGIAGMASAKEVINIDLNAQGNDIAYSGYAPTDVGTNIWRAYYDGWGKAMGSPRSANLADYNEPNKPGTYAAQVWIGDDANVAHDYLPGSGTGLMDDGFVKTGGSEDPDPNVRLWGIDAYGGTDPNFDIYVLSAEDGNFTLTSLRRNETKHVDGGEDNYAVFEDVNIADGPNAVTISYDNVLNGLQLVKLKDPVVIIKPPPEQWIEINATEYDVAYETNRRAGEGQQFGPDLGVVYESDAVMYLDYDEYMEYDITVDDANQGWYEVYAVVDACSADAALDIYLVYRGNDIKMGTIRKTQENEPGWWSTDDPRVGFNLFAGDHSIKWVTSGPEIYFNLKSLCLYRTGLVKDVNCSEVYKYGWNDPMDFDGDCHVDFNDLAVITDPCNWLDCYDPNTDNCP